MRIIVRLTAVTFLGVALVGCGGGSIKEGVPDGIDFTKDYSPMAKPIGINPKDAAKAEQASKDAAKNLPSTPTTD